RPPASKRLASWSPPSSPHAREGPDVVSRGRGPFFHLPYGRRPRSDSAHRRLHVRNPPDTPPEPGVYLGRGVRDGVPGGREPRRAVRRARVLRRALDPRVLPAHLPGADAPAGPRAVLRDGGGGRGRGVPRLPAVPPRGEPRLPRLGRPGGPGRAGPAPDR